MAVVGFVLFWVVVPSAFGGLLAVRYRASRRPHLARTWVLIGLILCIPSTVLYLVAAKWGNIFEWPAAAVIALLVALAIGMPVGLMFTSAGLLLHVLQRPGRGARTGPGRR